MAERPEQSLLTQLAGFEEAVQIVAATKGWDSMAVKRYVVGTLEDAVDKLLGELATPDCRHCHGRGRMEDGGHCVCIPDYPEDAHERD